MQAEEIFSDVTPLPQDQATSSLSTHDIQESPGLQPTLQNTSATSPKDQTSCTTSTASELCCATPHTSSKRLPPTNLFTNKAPFLMMVTPRLHISASCPLQTLQWLNQVLSLLISVLMTSTHTWLSIQK